MLYSVKMVNAAGPSTGERRGPPALVEGAQSFEPERENRSPASIEGMPTESGLHSLLVRSVRFGDVAGLCRLSAFYRLHQPESSLTPPTLVRGGIGSLLPIFRSGQPAFVACAGQRLIGFAQFQSVAADHRWRLLSLGASVGVFDADPVWEALLSHAVRDAGLRGVKRLYARLPTGLPLAEAFRRLGWSTYASETIFAGVPQKSRHRATSVRAQSPADTWAIHQLYSASVPRPVQNAEAYTSHRWDLRSAGRGRGSGPQAGWLIEDGHEVIGYARTTSRGGVHVLDVMVLPGRSEILDDLLSGALAALPDPPGRRILCAVRSYQAEVATALEGRGLVSTTEQDVAVKYTTASVRSATAETVPFHVEVRESLPQRVPSFLHGRPRDGSAD